MNSKLKNCLFLLTGIGIGIGISWTYHKNKYEEIIQEEIEDLRADRQNAKSAIDADIEVENGEYEDEPFEETEEDLDNAKHIIQYNKYAPIEEECMTEKAKKPFVITPDDFATIPGFDTDTFYYHNDDIVVNDNKEVVDTKDVLGLSVSQIKEQFGVHEDNAVYIRNYKLNCDYEILLDYSDFYDE